MTIEVHDEALRGLNLTQPQALLDLAVGLFTERRVTLGRAATVARVTQLDFQRVTRSMRWASARKGWAD